jgi:hypothetical protein
VWSIFTWQGNKGKRRMMFSVRLLGGFLLAACCLYGMAQPVQAETYHAVVTDPSPVSNPTIHDVALILGSVLGILTIADQMWRRFVENRPPRLLKFPPQKRGERKVSNEFVDD